MALITTQSKINDDPTWRSGRKWQLVFNCSPATADWVKSGLAQKMGF